MFGAEVRVGAGRGLRRTARIRGPSRVAAASSHPSSRPPPRAAYMFNPFPARCLTATERGVNPFPAVPPWGQVGFGACS